MAVDVSRNAPVLHRRDLGGLGSGERPRRVEEERRLLVLRKREAEERHVPRTRGLHFRPARERYGVVSRRRLFRRLVEADGIVALQRRVGIAGGGHETEVRELRTAGPAQVVLREAPDALVAVLVGGAVLPTGMARIRSRLDHAERVRGRRRGVSRASGADERIG